MASTNLAELQQGNNPTVSNTPKIFTLLDDPRCAKSIAAVAGKFFTPDRFLRLAINSIKKTPLLAHCDPQSVLGAFMASAALGLEPNTVQQQAFLIPYKKRKKVGNEWVDTYECQFQIGYRGFITLAHRSPQIDDIHAEAIHEHDLFDHMMGSQSFLKYRKSLKDRGELIGSFCHVKLASGGESACVLPFDELMKIRSKSETYNALVAKVDAAATSKDKDKALKNLDETPWVMWLDDMAAKSAIKKHAKQLPLSPGDAVSAAAQIDEEGERGAIDLSAMADVDTARSVIEDGALPPALEAKEAEYLEGATVGQAQQETIYVDQPNTTRTANVQNVNAQQQTGKAEQATLAKQGNIIPPNDDGPTVDDALANVARGDFDMARDLANSLGKEAMAAVESAIAAKSANKPAAGKGRGSFGAVE